MIFESIDLPLNGMNYIDVLNEFCVRLIDILFRHIFWDQIQLL